MTDDQGYGDFGFAGNLWIETPQLDRLADESATVERFYVSPVCTPTRANLMTGRYNYRTRAIDTYLGRAMMEPDEVTLAEVLGEAGYATGIFGKWHLGDMYPLRAIDQGFDEALVHRGGGIGQPSDPPGGEGKYTDPVLYLNDEERAYEGYCTDIYFDHALDFMSRMVAEDRPFFAYVPTNAPHGPFHDAPEAWYEHYRAADLRGALPDGATDEDVDRLARIYAMISNVDDNVGRVLDHLDVLGAADDTIVVFLVDNGPNGRRYTAGLRGQKGTVYEGGLRSPLLVRWPGRLTAGHAVDRIAAHYDLMPTLLEGRRCRGARQPRRPERAGASGRDHAVQCVAGSHALLSVAIVGIGRARSMRSPRWASAGSCCTPHPRRTRRGIASRRSSCSISWTIRARRGTCPSRSRTWSTRCAPPTPRGSTTSAARATTPTRRRVSSSGPRLKAVTTLTRQDWRRDSQDRGWAPRSHGHWLLEADRPATFGVELRFTPGAAAESLELSVGRRGEDVGDRRGAVTSGRRGRHRARRSARAPCRAVGCPGAAWRAPGGAAAAGLSRQGRPLAALDYGRFPKESTRCPRQPRAPI